MRRARLAAVSIVFMLAGPVCAQNPDLPRLDHGQLVVDGKPFLILGGELGHSSASDPAYLQTLWLRLDSIGLNTLLMPAGWDQIEPNEGRFDFTHWVDAYAERNTLFIHHAGAPEAAALAILRVSMMPFVEPLHIHAWNEASPQSLVVK